MTTELELYEILYRIIRGWPATIHSSGKEQYYLRLNTFAVVDYMEQITTGHLGKDARYSSKEFYYNRLVDQSGHLNRGEIAYPAVLLWENPYQVEELINKGTGGTDAIRFRMGFFSPYFNQLEPGEPDIQYGRQRTPEEIKASLRKFRKQLFIELEQWVYAETFLSSVSQGYGWYNKNYLQTLMQAATVLDDYKITQHLKAHINGNNVQAAMLVDVDSQGLVEHYIDFTLTLISCPTITVNHAAVDQARQVRNLS